MAAYVDIEAALISYLPTKVTYARYAVATPGDLLAKLPFVQIRRVGGADNNISDTAVVDIDSITATDPTNPNYAQARQLAEDIRAAMKSLRHTKVGNVFIDDVDVITAPIWIDYEDEHVNRFVASYQIISRIQ